MFCKVEILAGKMCTECFMKDPDDRIMEEGEYFKETMDDIEPFIPKRIKPNPYESLGNYSKRMSKEHAKKMIDDFIKENL